MSSASSAGTPRLRALLTIALCLLMAGCVQNMAELREALGYVEAPAADPVPAAVPEPEPERPIAKAAANATRVRVGEPVGFTATGSTDPSGGPLSFSWDLGDGTSSLGASVTHVYHVEGSYTIRLTVGNAAGRTDTDTLLLDVTKANEAPVAAFAASPSAAVVGEPFAFDASASRDPEGKPLDYAWDFGDGATAVTARPSHAYARPGTYPVTLTVRDAEGLTANVTRPVAVGYRGAFEGALSLAGPASAEHAIPVAWGAANLSLRLTFPAGLGAHDLRLLVLDAEGREAASAQARPSPGDTGNATVTLHLSGGDLALHAQGDWVARVTLARGALVEYRLDVDEPFRMT